MEWHGVGYRCSCDCDCLLPCPKYCTLSTPLDMDCVEGDETYEKAGIPWAALHLLKDNTSEIQEITVKAAAAQTLQSISHDFRSRIFPHIDAWTKFYGQTFIFSPGRGAILMQLADPRVVKEVFTYEKGSYDAFLEDIVGSGGIVFAKQAERIKQRRTVRPSFYPSRSKEMVTEMASWIDPWLDRLENLVAENGGAIDKDITTDVRDITKDNLAQDSFASSFAQGRSLPTPLSRRLWEAKREVANNLRDIMQGRRDSVEAAGSGVYGEDLLRLLLAEYESQKRFALTEAKLMLAILVQQFSLRLSPSYRHASFQNRLDAQVWGASHYEARRSWTRLEFSEVPTS